MLVKILTILSAFLMKKATALNLFDLVCRVQKKCQ